MKVQMKIKNKNLKKADDLMVTAIESYLDVFDSTRSLHKATSDLIKWAQKNEGLYYKEDSKDPLFKEDLVDQIEEMVDLIQEAMRIGLDQQFLDALYKTRQQALEIIEHEETRPY